MNGYTINLSASTFSLYKITNIVYVQRWSNLQLKKNLQEKSWVHVHAQSFLSVHIHSCNSLTPELT